jgi:hypothetical protein
VDINVIIWVCVFLPLILFIFDNRKKGLQQTIINTIRKKKGTKIMDNAIKAFIGKECIIYTISSQVAGVIESVDDGWVTVRPANKENAAPEIVNTDYISHIREYPRKKNGKKKAFVV